MQWLTPSSESIRDSPRLVNELVFILDSKLCLGAIQVPIQLASAGMMLLSADWAEQRLKEADIVSITALFFVLVLLAATQDIAVDGWALTLLSRPHIGWVCCPAPEAHASVILPHYPSPLLRLAYHFVRRKFDSVRVWRSLQCH